MVRRMTEEDFDKSGKGQRDQREELASRMHWEARRFRREMRQRRNVQRPPQTRYLFWGLMLIPWAVLVFLLSRDLMPAKDLWKAFVTGLGGIFIVRALTYYFSPSLRSRALGSLISGLIFTLIGLGFLFSYTLWLPVTLGIAGLAVILVSYFLQREIEKRQATQRNLRESEVKYRQIIDSANSVIMEMDPAGNVTFMNKFALDFFGYREDEILGRNVVGTIFPDNATSIEDREALVRNIVTSPQEYQNNEKENQRKNGEQVWMIWTYKPVLDEQNNLKEILCTAIDRTEQKRHEEVARREMREKTALEERTRLARDLHDAVSQTLFSTSLIADVLPRVWERDKEEGIKKLEDVRQLSRGALSEMRTLLFELRPAALADADLNELLRQLGESVFGRARVRVAVETSGSGELPTDVKIAFYRIAQEALNNVAKHSRASEAQVSFKCEEHSARLRIADNGKGFDMERVSTDRFGLKNMKERADQIGAQLEVDSKVGQGTQIIVEWHDQPAGRVEDGKVQAD